MVAANPCGLTWRADAGRGHRRRRELGRVAPAGACPGRRAPEPGSHQPLVQGARAAAQKKTFQAAEADEEEREGFRDLVAEMPHGRFLFVDETGVNTDLARRYGRAPRGERVVDATVPRNTPANLSLVGAMNKEGILCSMELEGAIDGAAFLVFVEEVLSPHLKRGDFVVLDNLNTHTLPKVEAAIYARGAFLLFLPRYSPDLNPIEKAWSKLKTYLKTALRGRPKRVFSGQFGRQAESCQHQPAHGQVDHTLLAFGQELVVAAQASVAAQPGEGALHHPAAAQHGKRRHEGHGRTLGHAEPAPGFLHHVHRPAKVLLNPLHQPTAVAHVSPQRTQAAEATPCGGEQRHRAVPIRDVGGMNVGAKHQPRAIY